MNRTNFFKLILFIGFVFIVCGCVKAENQEYLSYPTRKIILSNGLSLINRTIKENKITCIEILVKVGSSREGEFLGNGISHFTEHMVFKSNRVYKPGEIHKLAREWGGFINGYTGKDYTHFKITVLDEYLPEALELMRNMLLDADFKKDLVDKEREVILNEIKMQEDDPEYILHRLLFNSIYKDSTYSLPILGYEEKVKKVSVQDLTKFYKKEYVPSNMIMSVVGPRNFKEIMELVVDVFKPQKKGVPSDNNFSNEFSRCLTSNVKIKFYPTQLAYLNLAFRGISIEHEDLYALDVLSSILGGGGSSRLNKSLNIEKGLVNWIGAYNYTPVFKGFFDIYASTDLKRIKSSVRTIFEELEKIKKGDFTEREIRKAINRVKSSHIFGLETVQSQATSLVINEFLTNDYNFDERYIKRIQEINKDDIIRVAKKYLKFDVFNLIVLLPKDTDISAINDLLGKNYVSSDCLKDVVLDFNVDSWKDLFLEKAKSVDKKLKVQTEKFNLPNGMVLLVRKDSELPIVSLRCVFKGGVRAENSNNNGISNLTASTLLGGTVNLSKSDILTKIEQMGGSIGTDSGYNTFSVGINVLKEDFNMGLKILSDILKNSNFPKKMFEIEKYKQKQAVKAQEDSIFAIGLKNLRLALFKKHPYRFMPVGTVKTLDNIKRKDVVDFYNSYVNPKNMVFTIVGDIDIDRVYKEVKKNLEEWEKSQEYLPIKKIGQIKVSGVKDEIVYADKYQKLLMYGFHGIEITNKDRYSLEVLTRIISGGGSRLWQEIREKQGLSYSLGAYFIPGIDPGYFSIYIQTKSEDLNKIDKLIREQINIIKNGEFDIDEIKIAKNELIGNHLSGLQSNAGLAYQMSLDEIYKLGYDNFENYNVNINQVTKEDIINVANKYIDLNNFVIIKVLSETYE